jgi:DNA polymerase-3 subunit delta'
VRFYPLPESIVGDILREQKIETEVPIDRLTRMSGGSPGTALELADSALWEFRKALLNDLSAKQTDPVAIARSWSRFLDESGKDAAVQRRRAALIVQMLIEFFGDVLKFSAGQQARATDPDNLKLLQQLAGRINTDQCLGMLECCLDSSHHIDRRVQLALVIESLVTALSNPKSGTGSV